MRALSVSWILGAIASLSFHSPSVIHAEAWRRHSIDATLRGADGVRLADFNGDGLLDIVTGWEESGVVRLYLNPGHELAKQSWPAVSIGSGKSPEDAVFFDFDGDGRLEVVSCHEGKKKQVLVHRCLKATSDAEILNESNWETNRIVCLDGQSWMYAVPIKLRNHRTGIVLGSKNEAASVTLLQPPAKDPVQIQNWTPMKLRAAGWIMSIEAIDMDGDGDEDIVANDRKGSRRGVFWLEQPSGHSRQPWQEHTIGGADSETLFIEASPERVLASTRESQCIDFQPSADMSWKSETFANPLDVPFGKAIRSIGSKSYIMTANTSADKIKQPRPGIWLRDDDGNWNPIGSEPSTKFDRIELIDLDGDGDLDVLTCEERQNLGVIWFENPGIGN
jgi:hypothetical protein